jgi:outer membrane protein assembly factor BamB
VTSCILLAIVDGTVFIGSWDTYLYALDAATGKEKWCFKTGGDHETYNQVDIQGSPAVAGGILYFVAAIPTFTRSMRTAANNFGCSITRIVGDQLARGARWQSLFRYV